MILGHESSGQVVEVADDCILRKIGDRVAVEPGVPCRYCNYCREGMYNLCNVRLDFYGGPILTMSENVICCDTAN